MSGFPFFPGTSRIPGRRTRLFRWTGIFYIPLCLTLLIVLATPATVPVSASGFVLYAMPGGLTNGNCMTWAAACDLSYALIRSSAPAEIWVKQGTYVPAWLRDPNDVRSATFQLKSGVALYGGFVGTESARSQRNYVKNVTTLSGDIGTQNDPSDNAYHVVTGNGTDSTAILDGFTITGGNADTKPGCATGCGGGMFNNGGSPTVRNDIFVSNSAWSGAGMANQAGSNPKVRNVTFRLNSAASSSSAGGGMANWNNSNPALTNVTFSGNSAQAGGGLFNSNSSPTLTNITFKHNSARLGGGMADRNGSNPSLTNVTFSGNSAVSTPGNTGTPAGGGVYNDSSSPTLTNVTLTGNSAQNGIGGALNNALGSSPTVWNSILWGDSATIDPEIVNDGQSSLIIGFSVVQGGYGGGTNILNADPVLQSLALNGGITRTRALGGGSSAIDAGDPARCPATDQRGMSRRTANGFCDIGSYEAQPAALRTPSGNGQSTSINSSFAAPLTARVRDSFHNNLGGVVVTFSAPSSGASAALSDSTMVSGNDGQASVTATANSTPGSYKVTASVQGLAPVSFSLTNMP